MAFSDDFNRANGALAGSNGWVAHPTTVGAHSISDNRVVGETTQAVTYNTPAAGSANYRTTVTLVATGSTPSNYYGVLARASASALSGYHARWNSGNVQLYSVVAGALTQLGSNVAQTLAQDVPHDLSLVCDGDQISVEWDGATIIGPITNTAHTAEGVIILRSGANLVRFDDVVVETIGASAGLDLDADTLALSGSLSLAGDIESVIKKWRVPTTAAESTAVHVVVLSGTSPTYTIEAQGTATVDASGNADISGAGPLGTKALAFVHNYDDNDATTSINGGAGIATLVDAG